jgi:hypothetical protein
VNQELQELQEFRSCRIEAGAFATLGATRSLLSTLTSHPGQRSLDSVTLELLQLLTPDSTPLLLELRWLLILLRLPLAFVFFKPLAELFVDG